MFFQQNNQQEINNTMNKNTPQITNTLLFNQNMVTPMQHQQQQQQQQQQYNQYTHPQFQLNNSFNHYQQQMLITPQINQNFLNNRQLIVPNHSRSASASPK